MYPDALVLTLVAFADLALLFYLRKRRTARKRRERIMLALRFAVRRTNAGESGRSTVPLLRAS